MGIPSKSAACMCGVLCAVVYVDYGRSTGERQRQAKARAKAKAEPERQ